MDFMQKNHYNRLVRRMTERFFSENPGRNTFFSPLSILVLLSVVSESTAGETRVEILKLLRDYHGTNEFGRALADYQRTLSEGSTFSSANAVCVRSDFQAAVHESYRNLILSQYEAELFSDNNISETVNYWEKEKTKGMIDQLVSEDIKDTLLCMLNAVCFEGRWREPFGDRSVRDEYFCNADGTRCRVMMLLGSECNFVENDGFTGFMKHYMESPFSFMALLPKEKGESAMIRAVEKTDWLALYGSAKRELVHIKLPEFRFDCELDLYDFCASEGVKKIFTTDADFSPVAGEPLFMKSMMHKSHIEVDRLGTRAAALSYGVCVGCASPEGYNEVFLDRPFVFAVVHRETGMPVFIGNVNHLEDANYGRRNRSDREQRRLWLMS